MSAGIYSDLRLRSYVVTHLQMQVDPARELITDEGSLSLAFDVRRKPDSSDDYLLELTVSVNSDEADYETRGFRFACTVAGFFEVGDVKETYPESWETHLLSNGLSILFGIARVKIDELSAAAPMGRFVLPCVNMQEYLKARGETTAAPRS
ncbi:MAG: protein-export chaperone SecB [Coriobacteriia bacterium]|nr:protein-export chaperone SecB [Coriobacteriia bacterium]